MFLWQNIIESLNEEFDHIIFKRIRSNSVGFLFIFRQMISKKQIEESASEYNEV